MVEYISIQTALMLLQMISLTGEVIYYIMTLRNTQRTQQMTLEIKQTQILVKLFNRLDDTEVIQALWKVHGWKWNDFKDF